ncbi:hypothetical protein ABEB36_015791 [Hypothenemus hampei]|uniref:Uncharacterized protein n=1 Tax=Hypothenemus hampei TaxID=57062 RepID=A0ABD1E3C5_HYPHA
MTRRCDSNPAQYERNRRFGHLVHALARAGYGAKLPSVGLCLNASKAAIGVRAGRRTGPCCRVWLFGWRRDRSLLCSTRPLGDQSWVIFRCWNSELSVDDLRTWQGVVLGRAVSTLRSVETQPLAWGFVLSYVHGWGCQEDKWTKNLKIRKKSLFIKGFACDKNEIVEENCDFTIIKLKNHNRSRILNLVTLCRIWYTKATILESLNKKSKKLKLAAVLDI